MAEGDYVAVVFAPTSQGSDEITFECTIKREDALGEYLPIRHANRTIQLPAQSVLNITRDPGLTDVQKRQQLSALFDNAVATFGLAESDLATRDVGNLITFPQIRPVEV